MSKTRKFAVNRIALIGALLSSAALMNNAYAISANITITQQKSVVAENIKKEAQECADGKKEGSIGKAILDSVKAHLEIASAPPEVQRLFEVDDGCFADLKQLNDLSFAIPSLGSIMSSVQEAVMKYAEKKICAAVKKVSTIVTNPLNKAIDKVNNILAKADLNGLTNGLVANALNKLDPELGAEYIPAPGYNVKLDIAPFGPNQVTFTPGSSAQQPGGTQQQSGTQQKSATQPNSRSAAPQQPAQPQQQPAQQSRPAQQQKSGDVHSRASSLFG